MPTQTEFDFSIDHELPTLGTLLKKHGVSALHVTVAGDDISLRPVRQGVDGSPGVEGGNDESPGDGGTPELPGGVPSDDWKEVSTKTGAPCTCELVGIDTGKGTIKVKANKRKHPQIEVYGDVAGKSLRDFFHPVILEPAELNFKIRKLSRFDKNGDEKFKYRYSLEFGELYRAYFQRNARRGPK